MENTMSVRKKSFEVADVTRQGAYDLGQTKKKPLPLTGKEKKETPVSSVSEQKDDTPVDKASESRDFLRTGRSLLRHSVDSRKRYDYEWMVRDLFRRGYQFSKYQPTTNTIVLSSRQTAQIPINLVSIEMRSICNQVTSFRPKWEVMPRNSTLESKTVARYSQKILDYVFDTQHLKTKIKETVKQGLMFSVGGPWQIVYNKFKDCVEIWTVDTFDFFWDMFAESMEDCQYQIKAVRRPLEEIRKNKSFSEEARLQVRGGEERLAVSENKQFLVQSMRQLPAVKDEEYESVILFEGYFKTIKDNGQVDIRKMVWTDQNIDPLVDEMTGEEEFPFVLYRADLNPKEILGEGWMKHTMPLNRVINLLESSVFDYATRVAKGRILVDKDSGVDVIHTVHGEIIHKNRGAEVRNLEMPNLPHAVTLLIERMHRYIEDISGVHDATLGRLPAGVRSGIGVAELKQSDSTSQDDLVDNLEDFLEEVARKVLKTISRHYKTYHVIHALGYKDSDAKAFAVVGEKSGKAGNPNLNGKVKIGPDTLDLAIIGDDNMVRVNIGSWLGYTKEAAQEKALKLAEAGLISQKEVLSIFEFGDIDEIVQRTRRELLLKKSIDKPTAPGQLPQVDDYDLALEENDMMVNEFKDMPVKDTDDHLVHNALHQEALGRGQDDLVIKHMGIHNYYLGMGPQEEKVQEEAPMMPEQPPMNQTPLGMDQASMMAQPQGMGQQPMGGGMAY